MTPVSPPVPPRVVPKAAPPKVHGTHTGPLICALPLSDLHSEPHGGAWNTPPKAQVWSKSSLATCAGVPAVKVHHDKFSGTTADSQAHPTAIGGIGLKAIPRGFPMSHGGVVFAFDAFFPKGYKWARGGKIGGVSIGPGKSSAGRHTSDGASNRIMFQVDGGAILYVYVPAGSHQVDPRLQGTHDFGFGVFNKEFAGCLREGEWNHLEIGTKLNTFSGSTPNADGAGSLTINGVTHSIDKIVWRLHPEFQLNDVFLSEFFGGPDPSPVDQDCFYANFEVYAWKD